MLRTLRGWPVLRFRPLTKAVIVDHELGGFSPIAFPNVTDTMPNAINDSSCC
jgi:hypothetical protein